MGYWIEHESEPGEHQEAYDRLWKQLVPAQGSAETAQGEMIRSAGRLASEYYGNGNINWMGPSRDFYLGFVEYIERTFRAYGDPEQFARAEPYVSAVRRIGLYEADEQDFDFDPWDRLIHVVVEWCLTQPELLPVGTPAN